jgi:outer membrane protein assembly factor BamA
MLLVFGTAAAALAQTPALTDEQLLFAEGQERLRAGQPGMAKVSFETLIAVYPDSSLVRQARQGIRVAEEREPRLPVVRSIRFEHFRKIKTHKMLDLLREREIALAVDRTCDLRDLDQAKRVLELFVAQQGRPNCTVQVETRTLASRQVAVTFRLVRE